MRAHKAAAASVRFLMASALSSGIHCSRGSLVLLILTFDRNVPAMPGASLVSPSGLIGNLLRQQVIGTRGMV